MPPISRNSSLSQLLRRRPAVVELLEASGEHFWDQLDLSVEAYCRRAGLDAPAWLEKAMEMPVPAADSDWKEEPLHRITDFLTADHNHFRDRDLRKINELFDMHAIPVYPDKYVMSHAHQMFGYFEESFREHMHEEEDRVFPHILRLEACSRNPGLKPILPHVSVSMFAASQGHAAEKNLKKMVASIREKVRRHHIHEATAEITGLLYDALDDFEVRMIRHAEVETTVLFPRAVELENRFLRPPAFERHI